MDNKAYELATHIVQSGGIHADYSKMEPSLPDLCEPSLPALLGVFKLYHIDRYGSIIVKCLASDWEVFKQEHYDFLKALDETGFPFQDEPRSRSGKVCYSF